MYDNEEKKPSVVARLMRAAVICLMLGIYAILIVRFFLSCDSEIMEQVLKTPAIEAAYNSSPEAFEIQHYEIRSWYVSKNPADDEESDLGGKILSISQFYYIPQTRNLQLSVKFNTEILPDRQTAYSSELLPFELYLEDGDGNIYSDISACLYDEKNSYGYIRVNFEGIDLKKPDLLDEEGNPIYNTYNLYLKRRNKNGQYEQYEKFLLYDGKHQYSTVEYK